MRAVCIIIFLKIFQSYAEDSGGEQTPNCVCVPYYLCADDTGEVITDGAGLGDLRKFEANSTCSGHFDVCCNNPTNATESKIDKPKNQKGCGYPNSGSFSWSVGLFYLASSQSLPIYKCGASLIHQQAVITAAHCLHVVGMWIAKTSHSERPVAKVLLHQNYNPGTLANDLALLILKSPFEISNLLNTICVPPPGIIFLQKRCYVTSWKRNGLTATPEIKVLDVPIVSNDKCLQKLRTTKLGMLYQLHHSFICAGGENNKDVCVGDGGNPLVCPVVDQPGRYYQAGLVSWGIGCGEFNIPSVYVNLGLFRNWIVENLVVNGLNLDMDWY